MTADRAALVEKVAKEMKAAVGAEALDAAEERAYRLFASIAISLIRAEVLEEAARVVETEIDEAYTMEDRAKNAARQYAAATIRALKEKA